MNIAKFLVKYAESLEIDTCFTVTGGMAMHLNHELFSSEKITQIFSHHEQSAVCSAEGYSKVKNFRIPGLACITAGPGVSNSVTGLLSAFGDSTPVLILAGQVKTSDSDLFGLRTHGIQEINSRAIVSGAVKYFSSLTVQNLEIELLNIHRALVTGRPGPVFVEVPLDVQTHELSNPEILLHNIYSQSSTSAELTEASLLKIRDIVAESRRIALYIGNGTRISNIDFAQLLRVSRNLHLPRFYSWISADLDNFWSPGNAGCPGSLAPIYSNQFLQQCDLVIFIGARLDLATTGFQREKFGATGNRIIIDIDSAELMKFQNLESDTCVNYDLRQGLDWLYEILEGSSNSEEWIQELENKKQEYLDEEDKKLASNSVTVRDLALNLYKVFQKGTLVMSSSGFAIELFARFFRPSGNVRFFCGAALGSMGQGLSHGIGAILGRTSKDEPVWILESDGGLWMSVHELATLSQINKTNSNLFILNNEGYGSIANSQERHFNYKSGCDSASGLNIPDWRKICEVFGFTYLCIQEKEDLLATLTYLRNNESFHVVDIRISRFEAKGPSLKTTFTNRGPVTEPIEDLNW